jgi:hypothetical protein
MLIADNTRGHADTRDPGSLEPGSRQASFHGFSQEQHANGLRRRLLKDGCEACEESISPMWRASGPSRRLRVTQK